MNKMQTVDGVTTRTISEMTGIPMHTLHHWVIKGYVTPCSGRTKSGRSMRWNNRDYVVAKMLECLTAPRYNNIRKHIGPWIQNVTAADTLLVAHCAPDNPYRALGGKIVCHSDLLTDNNVMLLKKDRNSREWEFWLEDRHATVIMTLPFLQWSSEGSTC